MFLSMYASYHLAEIYRRTYVPTIILLVILISGFSTFHAFVLYILGFASLAFPVYALSFPFFYISDDFFYSPPDKIRFFSATVFSVSPQHTTSSSTYYQYTILYVFPFFLAVNVFGAVLGYWIHKRARGIQRATFSLFSRNLFLSLMFLFLFTPLLFLLGPIPALIVYCCFPFISTFFWIPAAIATLIKIRGQKT